jgi:hypothetical protein
MTDEHEKRLLPTQIPFAALNGPELSDPGVFR